MYSSERHLDHPIDWNDRRSTAQLTQQLLGGIRTGGDLHSLSAVKDIAGMYSYI